jgi:hypothetical protein
MKIWKDTAQAMINALSNELAVNAISSEIAQRQDGKIDKRRALQHNDVQLNNVKSATDALLKGQVGTVYSSGKVKR